MGIGADTLPQEAADKQVAMMNSHSNNDLFFIFFLPFTCMLYYSVYILFLYRKQGKNNIKRQMKTVWKILAVVALFVWAFVASAAERGINLYQIPRSAPSRVVYGEAGNRVRLSDFNGDFVIAVFWSRYCTPCIRELDSLRRFAERTGNNGIRVILISPQKEWPDGFPEQKRFLQRFGGNGLEIYVDHKNDLTAALGIFSSPVAVLISRNGQEIGRIRGSVDWDNPNVIEQILKIKASH